MQTTEPRLTWSQAAYRMLDVYFAECGRFDFEIRSTPDAGYLLRMYQIRPEDSALLFWERDGYGLDEAKEQAERLANHHVPVILAGPQ